MTVVMDDAVLVADAARMQDVRGVVEQKQQEPPTSMPSITGPGAGSRALSINLAIRSRLHVSGCILILTKPSAPVRTLGGSVWHGKRRPR